MEVNILWGEKPLCRCITEDDSMYYVALETYYYHSEYYIVNGIHIVPIETCELYDLEYYNDELFFC